MTPEERIRQLEAEVTRLQQFEGLTNRIREVELTVDKIKEKQPNTTVASITLSSACTSACFSSVSSIDVDLRAVRVQNPEMANLLTTLHEMAIDTLGQERVADAAIDQIQANKVVSIS